MRVRFEQKDEKDAGQERCVNTACDQNGDTRLHNSNNGCMHTVNTGKCKNFKGENIHPVGTIFSVLNEKDAEPYIGRMVEYTDNDEYRENEPWRKGIFKKIREESSDFPFDIKNNEYYHLIRLIEESFETPKPKVDPGLINALKLSVQQWQIMYDTDKIKEEVYKFLGGSNTFSSCFLCDFAGKKGDNTSRCHKCLDWKGAYCYDNNASPFQSYRRDNYSKPAMLEMLTHLKAELVRLESESK